jgi:CheY-like chemotaxis protein
MLACLHELQPSQDGTRPPPGPGEGTRRFTDAMLGTPVLVVEDEVLIAWVLEDMLGAMGFLDIRLARDHGEAIELAAERPPGLLICDVNLGSGHDGIETARVIRLARAVPVLFATGYTATGIRARIEEAVGPAPLMRKPIQPALLAAAVHETLSGPSRH